MKFFALFLKNLGPLEHFFFGLVLNKFFQFFHLFFMLIKINGLILLPEQICRVLVIFSEFLLEDSDWILVFG